MNVVIRLLYIWSQCCRFPEKSKRTSKKPENGRVINTKSSSDSSWKK